MNRILIGLVTCIVATVTVGCGTVAASQPVTGGQTTAAAHTTAAGHTGQAPGTGAPSGCHRAAPGGSLLLITMAGNGTTYCMRVGEQVAVQMRGTSSSRWQVPLASSTVLRPVPHGEMSLVAGLTEEWFVGARPGQVLITSVRIPCLVSKAKWEGGLEPTFPLPTAYPRGACVPEQRFSVSIVVVS
jgi:hypothetical protein